LVTVAFPDLPNSAVANAVALQPDGRIVVIGRAEDATTGAFAVARLLPPGGAAAPPAATTEPGTVLGGLSLRALALGASSFTVVMCADIWMFGQMMRAEYFGGTTVFGAPGRLVLGLIGALIVGGWLLAAFG
jgi:hypothetical protein